ncbi:glycoside hydrolase family 127 protein [Pedobacter hiemivivus]|nr:beta-L-arabinofuranosidase domain-containing protein [Pedobacter hiemivivus]
MDRITKKMWYIIFVPLMISNGQLFAQSSAKMAINDGLRPSSEVHLKGYLADQLDGSLNNRILAQDVQRLIEPFKLENRTETLYWQSEFWGKWFTSAVLAYKYHPDPRLKKVLDDAVNGLMATQTPDGYIGNYAETNRLQRWDIWGRKYCMLGLLAYYDLTKNKKMLSAAVRAADNLISDLKKQDGIIVTKGSYRGMAASSVLEPICLLYQYTNNKKYLDFAEEIVRQWETPEGPQLLSKSKINVSERFPKPKSWYSAEQGQKAYEMMSCYEGLLELYRLTGKAVYKQAVENTWENIRNTEINIAGSGASTEMWFKGKEYQNTPVHHYQETCVAVTWLKLSNQLLRLTGETKYADAVETAYYNALLGAMSSKGAVWAKYTPLNGQRLSGNEQCGMGLNCCDASGPRGLFNLPSYMVMERNEGLQINYFAEGNYIVKSPKNQRILVVQSTDYPLSGAIKIGLNIAKPEAFDVHLRIPAWSKLTKLSVNGEELTDLIPGQAARINRVWKLGDQISLELDMRGRVVETGSIVKSMAIMRGPIVLARDSRFEGAGLEAVLKPVTDAKGYIELTRLPAKPEEYLMSFKARFIPESYTEKPQGTVTVALCDYASAGNGPVASFYKVWMPQLFNPQKTETPTISY